MTKKGYFMNSEEVKWVHYILCAFDANDDKMEKISEVTISFLH